MNEGLNVDEPAPEVTPAAPLTGGLVSLPPKELEVDIRLPVFPSEDTAPPGFSFNCLFK